MSPCLPGGWYTCPQTGLAFFSALSAAWALGAGLAAAATGLVRISLGEGVVVVVVGTAVAIVAAGVAVAVAVAAVFPFGLRRIFLPGVALDFSQYII